MQVDKLQITSFRNVESLQVSFGDGVNVLYGGNGSGKTNLLEAVFTLCLGRSQRGAKDTVLVKDGAGHYRLQGEIDTGRNKTTLAVAYEQGGRKKITIDSAQVRASELYEQLSLVAAGPEDSDILSGPPSSRRLFLDLYLAQLNRTYLADLSEYQRIMAQRNAALKNEMDATPFDPLLVTCGSRIMLQRGLFLEELGELADGIYGEITSGEQFSFNYQPKVPIGGLELDDIMTAFASAIEKNAWRERAMQTCLVGPHRDEIEFRIAGYPARTHGSQGQWRAAAIALKLSIFELLANKRQSRPILLLDEIFAELDRDRSDLLIKRFFDGGQLFLTTAVEPPSSLLSGARRYRIESGTVVEEA